MQLANGMPYSLFANNAWIQRNNPLSAIGTAGFLGQTAGNL
jgi:hypothetical protein